MDWRALLLRIAARRLRVGDEVLRHLTTFQRLGERFEVEAPADMVTVGARTIARALRTRSAAQIRPDWLWPRWLERQLDPRSPAFIPRGHLPFASNATLRNWTAVGDLDAEEEATVDPAGLVTPRTEVGWSIDWWVRVDGSWIVPSRSEVRQRLRGGLPIVETVLDVDGAEIVHRAYGAGGTVAIEIANGTDRPVEVALAVRPYDGEGLAVIEDVGVDAAERAIRVDHAVALRVDRPPTDVAASTYLEHDSHRQIVEGRGRGAQRREVHDPAGLAQAALVVAAAPGDTVRAHAPIRVEAAGATALRDVETAWRTSLERGVQVRLPDERLQEAVEANRAYLLLFHDPGSITPGPSTYHRFWFRDAAYLVAALDRWGFHAEAADVLASYPDRQLSDGFFFSQWREWDANGAAIWTIAEHHRLTGDVDLLRRLVPAVRAGVNWIERIRDPLLPPGVSAEHLGPFDYYFWDDLWAVAGMQEAATIAASTGERRAAARLTAAADRFLEDLWNAIRVAATATGRELIPAGPKRGVDAGMIGSLVGAWPLRILPLDHPYLLGTVETIRREFTLGDAFYQGISHTGLGTYLTLQLAFVELQLGEPAAWRRLRWMLDAATDTWTWPEAIHPQIGGGCMGDGHHGWAAAEFLSFVRTVLVHEPAVGTVALLSVLPDEWIGGDLEVAHAPTHEGVLSYDVRWHGGRPTLRWQWERGGGRLVAPGLDPGWQTTDPAGEATFSPPSGADGWSSR